jgi:hypothetical protein
MSITLDKFSMPFVYLPSGVKKDKNLKFKTPAFWL